jgi:hypothetical protein
MQDLEIKAVNFKFQYLPDYAHFLLGNKLEEFTQVGIRFCREADLPMLRPLAKMSEKDLIALSLAGNQELLNALASNNIATYIETNIKKFITNQINDANGAKLIDRSEILAEDIILAFYLRRKIFAFFLYAYTQNTVIHTLIIAELDYYTTEEQLLTSKAIIKQHDEDAKKVLN